MPPARRMPPAQPKTHDTGKLVVTEPAPGVLRCECMAGSCDVQLSKLDELLGAASHRPITRLELSGGSGTVVCDDDRAVPRLRNAGGVRSLKINSYYLETLVRVACEAAEESDEPADTVLAFLDRLEEVEVDGWGLSLPPKSAAVVRWRSLARLHLAFLELPDFWTRPIPELHMKSVTIDGEFTIPSCVGKLVSACLPTVQSLHALEAAQDRVAVRLTPADEGGEKEDKLPARIVVRQSAIEACGDSAAQAKALRILLDAVEPGAQAIVLDMVAPDFVDLLCEWATQNGVQRFSVYHRPSSQRASICARISEKLPTATVTGM